MAATRQSAIPKVEILPVGKKGALQGELAMLQRMYKEGDSHSLSYVAGHEFAPSDLLSCIIHKKLNQLVMGGNMTLVDAKCGPFAKAFRRSGEYPFKTDENITDEAILYDALMNRSLNTVDLDLAVQRMMYFYEKTVSQPGLEGFGRFLLELLEEIAENRETILPATLDRMSLLNNWVLNDILKMRKETPEDTLARIGLFDTRRRRPAALDKCVINVPTGTSK